MFTDKEVEEMMTDMLDNMKTPKDSAKTIAALLVSIIVELKQIKIIMKEGKK